MYENQSQIAIERRLMQMQRLISCSFLSLFLVGPLYAQDEEVRGGRTKHQQKKLRLATVLPIWILELLVSIRFLLGAPMKPRQQIQKFAILMSPWNTHF